MASKVLMLNCITNMHVGNGDVNYNIVDNEVERDAITGYPTINASGVKGALKVYMKNSEVDDKSITDWFGGEGNEGANGKVKILSANMLAMPVRATQGKRAYYLVTTEEMIDQYKRLSKALDFTDVLSEKKKDAEGGRAEDIELNEYYEIDNKKIYVISSDRFSEIDLPVIARNKLDNGESKNLWYEEVVSHESIFYVPVVSDDNDMINNFTNKLDNKVVQFGGNASIGYGLCAVVVK